jgi:riboflavin kinase/FMN adenylyltransferase
VEHVLADGLQTRLIVVGADFHFGYRRHGDVPLLQRMGAELGFEVLGLGLVAAPDGSAAAETALPYSSTRVRALLAEGNVESAAAILGRPHEIRGPIAVEDGRAHISVPGRVCLPVPGRYRAAVTLGEREAGTVATVANDDGCETRAVGLEGIDATAERASLRFLARA